MTASNATRLSSFLADDDDDGDDVGDGSLTQVAAAVGAVVAGHEDDGYDGLLHGMMAALSGSGNWTGGANVGRSTETWDLSTSNASPQCRGYSWPVLFLFTIVILAIGRWHSRRRSKLLQAC